MSNPENKKTSPALLFGAGFILVFIIMFIVNLSNTTISELPSPPGGIENLYTINNQLVCISDTSEIYLWNWDRLDEKPVVKTFNSQKLLLSSSDDLVMIPLKNKSSVTIRNFRTGAKKSEFKFGDGWQYLQLAQAHSGRHVTIAQSQGSTEDGRFRFERLSEQFDSLEHIVTIVEKNFSIFEIAVSDDGSLIAVAGRKDKVGGVAIMRLRRRRRR